MRLSMPGRPLMGDESPDEEAQRKNNHQLLSSSSLCLRGGVTSPPPKFDTSVHVQARLLAAGD